MSILSRVRSRVAGGSGGQRSTPVGAAKERKIPDSPEGRALYDRVAAISFWFHSLDLGHGVITPGFKSPEMEAEELASFQLPDLHGKSVLDIGSWDGFYTFTAERLGASRVVALDKHVWALNWEAKRAYRAECKAKGVPAQPYHLVPQVWDFEGLPGKRGFNLAHEVLRSNVTAVVDDFMKMDLDTIGAFDVVFYLGVLYHMENPLESLRRLRQVTKEVAIIETAAITLGGSEELALCEFYPLEAKLADDPSNFWAPNARALIGLCQTAGFRRVEILNAPLTPPKGSLVQHRLVAHAFV